ncbi:MAG: hypothetical protein ACTS8H_04040 [Arsenophonus sp. NC-PE1-MAG3]
MGKKTENTRISYPVYHINGIIKPISKAGLCDKNYFFDNRSPLPIPFLVFYRFYLV